MADKLLVIIPHTMPTTEIALRTIRHAIPSENIRVVEQARLDLKDIFSGEYKLMFMRQHHPHLNPLIRLIIRLRIPYLYYIDDNFWEISGNTPIARCYKKNLAKKTFDAFVKHAFCVITPSMNLRDYIKQYTNKVICIHAAFDYDMLKNIMPDEKNGVIKLLYSGTPYREKDFLGVINALKRIAVEYNGKVEIHFNGFIPEQLKLTPHIVFDEHFYPYEEYIQRQFKKNFDIGIAPIADTLFNRAKSCLKFREYSACGIAGVYSNIPPYSDYVTDKETGLLTNNTESGWYTAIKMLIDTPNLKNHIVKQAEEVIRQQHTHAVIAPLWAEIITTLPSPINTPISSAYLLVAIKLKGLLLDLIYKSQRTIDYFRYEGIAFTFKKIQRKLFA